MPKTRDERLAYMRNWYFEHLEEQRAKVLEYQRKHPQQHLDANRRYSAKKRKSQTLKDLLNSATWIGRKAEEIAVYLLNAEDCNKKTMNNSGFDILWNGLKIDVKSRTAYLYKGSLQWAFHSATKCDLVLCMCFSEDRKKLERIFLIPREFYHKSGITVGKKTKWDCFQIHLGKKSIPVNYYPTIPPYLEPSS